jgi:hypothetical protein
VRPEPRAQRRVDVLRRVEREQVEDERRHHGDDGEHRDGDAATLTCGRRLVVVLLEVLGERTSVADSTPPTSNS